MISFLLPLMMEVLSLLAMVITPLEKRMLQLPLCSDKRMLLLSYKDVLLSVNSTLLH